MRVVFVDPGLCDFVGHHASQCRAIRRELERRGVQVHLFAHQDVVPELQTELGAVPLFRAYTYWQTDQDPFAGTGCPDTAQHSPSTSGGRTVAFPEARCALPSLFRSAGAVPALDATESAGLFQQRDCAAECPAPSF